MVDKAKDMDTKAKIAGTRTNVPKPICLIFSDREHLDKSLVLLTAHHRKKSLTFMVISLKMIESKKERTNYSQSKVRGEMCRENKKCD